MSRDQTPQHINLAERNHVEKPFLGQLDGLGRENIDLDGFIEVSSKTMEA